MRNLVILMEDSLSLPHGDRSFFSCIQLGYQLSWNVQDCLTHMFGSSSGMAWMPGGGWMTGPLFLQCQQGSHAHLRPQFFPVWPVSHFTHATLTSCVCAPPDKKQKTQPLLRPGIRSLKGSIALNSISQCKWQVQPRFKEWGNKI